MPLPEKNRQDLRQAATQARSQAYAPYSCLRVGASVLTMRGNIYTGANVENASYSLSLCAERAALAQAVTAEGPDMRVRALAVVSDRPGPLPPCGACRQVVFEFGPEALTELFPQAFRLPG
jgi:cytidine deaminase